MRTKVCSQCETEKSTTEFYPRGKNKDKLTVWCKTCFSEHNKKWRQENKEARKEYQEI